MLAMAEAPWSTALQLNWRSTLRFFERRYEIMREVEDRFGVAAYRHDGDLVAAQLAGGLGLVELEPDGLHVRRTSRDGDVSALREVVALALTSLELPAIRHGRAWFKYVRPLDSDLATAVASSMSSVLGEWRVEAGVTDFALLYDGVWRDRDYQLEFGISTGDQIPARLAGVISRTGHRFAGMYPDLGPLPDANLFVDISWPVEDLTPVQTGSYREGIEGFFSQALQSSGEIVDLVAQTIGLDGGRVDHRTA